jgi:hypothetical protein
MNRFKAILSSQECEYFSIAFLYHCIVIGFLAVCFVIVDKPEKIFSIVIQNDTSVVDTETFIEPEITRFDPETTSFDDSPIIPSNESSLAVDNKIEIPATVESSNLEVDSPDFIGSNIGDVLAGVGDSIGKGVSAENNTGGALDRLTAEIISNASDKNLNVLWLFDASISLYHQREDIQKRFDKILSEISFSQNPKYTVNHGIFSFGISHTKLSDFTDNADILKKSLFSISLDPSGIENIFQAVYELSNIYGKKDPRLMIIVFTDEIGDDISYLDKAATSCRKKGTMVYVVGSPAPFGKSKTQFKYVDPDPTYDQSEKWVEIQQGPETLYPMILDIRSLPMDDQTLDSGYGPFALCSLCSETGGIFFSVHPNRSSSVLSKRDISPLASNISKFFDTDVMRKYSPDYRSFALQTKENQIHKIKQSLVQASSVRLDIVGEQTLRFSAFTEGDFVNELNKAQRFSAKIEPKINQILITLQNTEKEFDTLKDKRWKASYALAMGRILAAKTRIELYNQVLAEAKTGLKKKDQKTNVWVLNHTDKFATTNSQLNKNYKQAQYYLNYVVSTYPDTPWAYIAHEEIKTPFGYEWIENYVEPPKMGGGGNNNPNPPKDDTIKKLQPKPQRKIEKI